MKKYMLLSVLILSAGLSGCREKGSESKKAIQHSLKMLNENRVQDFQRSLTGQAREQMKTEKAVEAFRQKIADLGELSFGNENVVDSSSMGGDTVVVTRIEVKRGRDVIGSVDVRCETDYSSHQEQVCEEYREPTPRYRDDDNSSWSPNPPRYDGRNDGGGSSGGSSSDGDRDRDSGYRVPGDSSPKPDPNENRSPDRPPRYPGSNLTNMSGSLQNFSSRRCHMETRTSSQTTCQVSAIGL